MGTGRQCPACAAPATANAAFCTSCGARLPPADAPGVVPAAPDTAPTPPQLAATPTQPQPAATPATPDGPPSPPTTTPAEPPAATPAINTWVAVALVALASIVMSAVGWSILGLPARVLREAIPAGDCTAIVDTASSEMAWCSAKVGFLTVLGPLLVVLSALFLRRPLGRLMRGATQKVPPAMRFLVAPTMATALFTMAYAEIHRGTESADGYLPQRVFPVVVGLFMFAVSRAGPVLGRKMGRFFDVRDRVPMWLRVPLALLVPVLIGYLMMRGSYVTDAARKEQTTILLSLATTFLAVVPRSGSLESLSLVRSPRLRVPR